MYCCCSIWGLPEMRWFGRVITALPLVILCDLSGGPVSAGQTVTGIACSRSVFYDTNANGATQLVAAGSTIYICGYKIATNNAMNLGLVFGTGTNCATGQTKITPAYVFAANAAGIASIGEDTQQ